MSQSKIVGGVEIGTEKILVLVGEIVNGRSLTLIGMGESSSRGVKKGEVLDFKAASGAVHAAIMQAERSASAQLDTVYLAQSGSHLQGEFTTAEVMVRSSDNIVSQSDIERVTHECKSKELPDDRLYIHHMKNPFHLDGRELKNPLRMSGRRLEAGYWSVHGNKEKVSDNIHVVNGYGLNVEDLILSSIASGLMVTDESEREAGVLVLDMGAGTTDWALYRQGMVRCSGSVAVGGDHICNDLSLGLRVNRKNAGKMLLQCGKALVEKEDRSEKVWMVGDQMIGDRYIAKHGLVQIIELRVKELFSIVKKQLGPLCDISEIPAGAVLSGGLSRLPGIEVAAGQALNVNTRLGQNPSSIMQELRGPEYSTSLGLLHFALTGQNEGEVREESSSGLLRKVRKMFALS